MMTKRTGKPTALTIGCLLIALAPAGNVTELEGRAVDVPLHEMVLEYLSQSTEVVPDPLPETHPFRSVYNKEAIIPPQCYTKTDGQFNPCYVCHQNRVAGQENTMDDGALQVAYSFSDLGMTNHWKNLFEDRTEAVARISDAEIMGWVEQDNYSALPGRLRDAGFAGWIPDLDNLQEAEQAFDEEGFALDGSQWVAFNYKPLPSTFWPTNGATDDVMIRLPEEFRIDAGGKASRDIYLANLAVIEASIKGLDSITVPPIDEKIVGKDLNGDGKFGVVSTLTDVTGFAGAAKDKYLDTYLYPEGTEFLHTVRYLGFEEGGEIVPSRRMKEVRYMRKWKRYPKIVYERYYQLESFAKEIGQLPQYNHLGDYGLDNGFGWSIQGFIEDRHGELRAATYEETLFCMGCHTSIGSTIDKTFSFARKVDGADGWGYIDLKGMPDAPTRGEARGEIATYLERVGGGGEFRSNREMLGRWFDEHGRADREAIASAADVYELITPSTERALALNKAYRVIVEQQDYMYGRDATITPPVNVYEHIDNQTAPTLPASAFHRYDIRLDWDAASIREAVARYAGGH